MDVDTATRISNAAQDVIAAGTLASHYNVFVLLDGSVDLEPVSG